MAHERRTTLPKQLALSAVVPVGAGGQRIYGVDHDEQQEYAGRFWPAALRRPLLACSQSDRSTLR